MKSFLRLSKWMLPSFLKYLAQLAVLIFVIHWLDRVRLIDDFLYPLVAGGLTLSLFLTEHLSIEKSLRWWLNLPLSRIQVYSFLSLKLLTNNLVLFLSWLLLYRLHIRVHPNQRVDLGFSDQTLLPAALSFFLFYFVASVIRPIVLIANLTNPEPRSMNSKELWPKNAFKQKFFQATVLFSGVALFSHFVLETSAMMTTFFSLIALSILIIF